MIKLNLNDNWELRYEDLYWGPETASAILEKKEKWMRTDIPCDVHMPLIRDEVIEEPLVADHALSCEWIEDKSWWFKKEFDTEEGLLAGDRIELVLESLDAEGDIFLNGHHLGHHRSAFYPFIYDVKKLLKKEGNVLLVRVTSGLEHYSEQDIACTKKSVSIENKDHRSDPRRTFVRKPQYAYGWDWGPRVATCGIMKEVAIRSFKRIAVRKVWAYTKEVHEDADLGFEIEIENFHPFHTAEGKVRLEMEYAGKSAALLEEEVLLRSGVNYISMETTIKDPHLWWPNGMGDPSLYTIKVEVSSGDVKDQYPSFQYGIRTIKLNMERLGQDQRRFALEVNGVRMFAKGGNWIPADSIYARVTREKYDTLVKEAKESNFNMLRVWGGGLYEPDVFYEKCDEYGILIWHDFMFACALYPDHLEWFQKEVENEAEYQTQRLRNHPSIALWSGNNENHWGFGQWWIGERQGPFLGGALCYNEIIPRIVKRNCPNIPYWNSSPYGGEDPNGNDVGDRHHWGDCTMNPDMEKRITPEEYDKVSAKFVSEYGYIGPCVKSSILQYHGNIPLDRKGPIWQMHNNTFEKDTVPAGIAKHYGDPEKLGIDEYLLYAGLCQGLMLNYSLEAIRFKEECYGSLFWMYNDCWGEVGWTIIDYYLRRKPSYYFVKRAFAPAKLIMRAEGEKIKVVGINDTAHKVDFTARYGYTSFNGVIKDTHSVNISLQPYSRRVVLEFDRGDHDFTQGICFAAPEQNNSSILPAVLRTGVLKDLDLPQASLKVTDFVCQDGKASFIVSSDVYAHAVHFEVDENIHLSDAYFDLLPGETRKVTIENVPDDFALPAVRSEYRI